MAEVELSVLQRQCLDRRLVDRAPRQREVAAWRRGRNAVEAALDRRFTTTDGPLDVLLEAVRIEPGCADEDRNGGPESPMETR